MEQMTIKMRKLNRSHFWLATIVGFIAVAMITGLPILLLYLSDDPTLSAQYIINFCLFWALYVFMVVYLAQSTLGKITVSKSGVQFSAPFLKPFFISWNEINTCVADRMYNAWQMEKAVYISPEVMQELDYRPSTYTAKGHFCWTNLLTKHHVSFSMRKRYQLYLDVEICGEELEKFKTFLPDRLYMQLQDSEKALSRMYPKLKP